MKRSAMFAAVLIVFICDARGQECIKNGSDIKEPIPVFTNAFSLFDANGTEEPVLFPNPCRNELQISCPRYVSNARLEIYNCEGQLVLQEEMHGTDLFMNVQYVACGMYHVRISSDSETLAQGKFVKE